MKAIIVQDNNQKDFSFEEIQEEGWYRGPIHFDLLFLKEGTELSPTIAVDRITKNIYRVREDHEWGDHGYSFKKLENISYQI